MTQEIVDWEPNVKFEVVKSDRRVFIVFELEVDRSLKTTIEEALFEVACSYDVVYRVFQVTHSDCRSTAYAEVKYRRNDWRFEKVYYKLYDLLRSLLPMGVKYRRKDRKV